MAYIRECHTPQTLKYLVLHISLCLVHSLGIAHTTHCYKGNWKEKNSKKDLRKKEGRGDSSENTENIINPIQYVHNEWALKKGSI